MRSDCRETAGATTCLIVRYVRMRGGDDAVERLLAHAGMTGRLAELEDEKRWFSYEEKIALFEAAAAVTGDPDVTRHIGEEALQHQVGAGLRVLLRTLGSPRVVLSNVARAAPKFSTVADMAVVEMGRRHAVISYELHDGKAPHRLDCLLNQGLLSVIGPLFGRPHLEIQHDECQVDGAPRCVYRVSWPVVQRRAGRRRNEEHLREQYDALASQLRDMQSTAADLVSADDIATVLDRIVRRAGSAISAPRFVLAVERPAHGLEVHSDGVSPETARGLAAELLAGAGTTDDRIVVQVASAERNYGVIAAFYDQHTYFEQESELLAAYARSAAAVLDAASALEEAREREQRNAALLHLAQAVSDISDPDVVAQRLADAMPAVLGGSAAMVLLAEGTDRLRTSGLAGWWPEEHSLLTGFSVARGSDDFVTRWFEDPFPSLITEDTGSDVVRRLLAALSVDAIAQVPLRRRGDLLGVAAVAFRAAELPADIDALLEQCGAVAEFGATSLENATLLAKLQHRALHDELTALPNRAYFEEQVESALQRSERDGVPLAVLFLDLDRFKEANDSFGHDVGDVVLATVAQRLAGASRAGDVVARLGGDEFAVLLWNADASTAMDAAERLRSAVEFPIDIEHGVGISVSIGVAMAERGESYQQVVRRADHAMYEAKRRGRNLCVADAG